LGTEYILNILKSIYLKNKKNLMKNKKNLMKNKKLGFFKNKNAKNKK
jgi:hypothetical protein